ncbi:hypothetical protein QU487_20555 [Crenobacter sp. SG2305]|uniref:hypothetical protein n=1 Tax=Crenobacter oryzisoli TaxID=3056844 RepID=UPI0025AA6FD1|nr:hypothetical protein [Crenobacter sp. SG2305]MDN0085103.1 hypothetical protein [Crenobacter sp. SG2305]
MNLIVTALAVKKVQDKARAAPLCGHSKRGATPACTFFTANPKGHSSRAPSAALRLLANE